MKNIQSLISEIITSLYGVDFSPEISPAPKPELGEYCINVFPLAKILNQLPQWEKSHEFHPHFIATMLANALVKYTDTFTSTSATGGYVNFFLTDSVWLELFQSLEWKKTMQTEKTIVVDYIGMNVWKPPHIGHICTPLQWQSIINVMRHQGYRVIGDSHLWDWWLLFWKLIVGYKNIEIKKNLTLMR